MPTSPAVRVERLSRSDSTASVRLRMKSHSRILDVVDHAVEVSNRRHFLQRYDGELREIQQREAEAALTSRHNNNNNNTNNSSNGGGNNGFGSGHGKIPGLYSTTAEYAAARERERMALQGITQAVDGGDDASLRRSGSAVPLAQKASSSHDDVSSLHAAPHVGSQVSLFGTDPAAIKRRFGPAAGAGGADPKTLAEIDAASRAAVARSRPRRQALVLPKPGRKGVSFTRTPRFEHSMLPMGASGAASGGSGHASLMAILNGSTMRAGGHAGGHRTGYGTAEYDTEKYYAMGRRVLEARGSGGRYVYLGPRFASIESMRTNQAQCVSARPASELTGPGYYDVEGSKNALQNSAHVSLPPLSSFASPTKVPDWVAEKRAMRELEHGGNVGPGSYDPPRDRPKVPNPFKYKEPRFGSPRKGSFRSSLFAVD